MTVRSLVLGPQPILRFAGLSLAPGGLTRAEQSQPSGDSQMAAEVATGVALSSWVSEQEVTPNAFVVSEAALMARRGKKRIETSLCRMRRALKVGLDR